MCKIFAEAHLMQENEILEENEIFLLLILSFGGILYSIFFNVSIEIVKLENDKICGALTWLYRVSFRKKKEKNNPNTSSLFLYEPSIFDQIYKEDLIIKSKYKICAFINLHG